MNGYFDPVLDKIATRIFLMSLLLAILVMQPGSLLWEML